MKIYQSFSSKETERIGAAVAREILDAKTGAKKSAAIFALRGNLGSGKTTFAKGFFRGLGVKSRVKSPTFVIMRRSRIRGKMFTDVFHIDAYRLRKPEALLALDFKIIAADPKNIVLVEWPENAKGVIPRGARHLEFRYGKKENERKIIIK
jgi:tRNA threonylcarbamoyladenosine biosynthesis protein TsaE